MGLQRIDQTAPTECYPSGIGTYPSVTVQQLYRGGKAKAQGGGGAIMEDTLATPRFARYHQAMESADRLITEAMSADKNFELQLLQIQQQLDVTLTS